MNMKKTITNFRQFARERRKVKLVKTKRASFVVKYQEGAQSPQMENVTVRIEKDAAIFFYSSNGKRFSFLLDIHIETFDDTIPGEVTLIIPGEENVHLVFINPTRKEEFIAALTAFLGHSNNPSPSGSDSGRSTLS